jgi:hypothetical protein
LASSQYNQYFPDFSTNLALEILVKSFEAEIDAKKIPKWRVF